MDALFLPIIGLGEPGCQGDENGLGNASRFCWCVRVTGCSSDLRLSSGRREASAGDEPNPPPKALIPLPDSPGLPPIGSDGKKKMTNVIAVTFAGLAPP
jgi:hypothetical protein